MKIIPSAAVEAAVCDALLAAQYNMEPALCHALECAASRETGACARHVLTQIAQNYEIARSEKIAVCQDSGMSIVFAQVGQSVQIDGDFEAAVNAGVRNAHKKGYLRTSVVRDPLFDRVNTGDGCPAILHTRLVPGEQLRLTVMAKGFGIENCSRMHLFVPADPLSTIEDFIVNTVLDAGSKSCPPVIVGVGVGGTIERAALLAKWATGRSVGEHNPLAKYAELEQRLLAAINRSGIGPGGLGGRTTALAVNIEAAPTHIASIPVVVNLCCHASRHHTVTL